MNITGDKKLIGKLKQLPRAVQNKILRPALRKGARLEQRETQATAPTLSGLMRRSLTVRALKAKRGRIGSMVAFRNVDQLVRVSKDGQRYFYPAAVEYGHGNVEGTHSMREAFDAHVQQIESLIINEIKTGIEQL